MNVYTEMSENLVDRAQTDLQFNSKCEASNVVFLRNILSEF